VATNKTISLPGDPRVVEAVSEESLSIDIKPVPTRFPSADLPTPEPWDGVSRGNISLMGLDYRDWEAGETPRTDSMMVLTLEPVNNTAGMLSFPR
jgi:hypothetical protein